MLNNMISMTDCFLSSQSNLEHFALGLSSHVFFNETKLKQCHDLSQRHSWIYMKKNARLFINKYKRNTAVRSALAQYRDYLTIEQPSEKTLFDMVTLVKRDLTLPLSLFFNVINRISNQTEIESLWIRHLRFCRYLLQAIRLQSIYPKSEIRFNAFIIFVDDKYNKHLRCYCESNSPSYTIDGMTFTNVRLYFNESILNQNCLNKPML
ncbi:hypothetical protein L0B53_04055 [Vibrio sp. SS-MA-C1-2]|uniref:hypothetical protein n=1 Tax=Vibrio sp. SS-MA-C1-2 TaxID=2908646 RepID=UPI001F4414B8|nr:hypothetical protein [Vibrio sp. SS-MA-C1-2]UJF17099.1 hypothetical protein L0B53_04055 [Vibrio sp. SS-MA-C1-2]